MKRLLYLDDRHSPEEKLSKIALEHFDKVIWVKGYVEFVNWIMLYGLPESISFDHDLHESQYAPPEHWVGTYRIWRNKRKSIFPNGRDCARFLVKYSKEHKVQLPVWSIHSLNPIGAMEITQVLIKYAEKFYNQNLKKEKKYLSRG